MYPKGPTGSKTGRGRTSNSSPSRQPVLRSASQELRDPRGKGRLPVTNDKEFQAAMSSLERGVLGGQGSAVRTPSTSRDPGEKGRLPVTNDKEFQAAMSSLERQVLGGQGSAVRTSSTSRDPRGKKPLPVTNTQEFNAAMTNLEESFGGGGRVMRSRSRPHSRDHSAESQGRKPRQ